MSTTPAGQALLKLINRCDNYPYQAPNNSKDYYIFALLKTWSASCTAHQTVGYIPSSVVETMPWTIYFGINHDTKVVTIPFSPEKSESEILAELLSLAREKGSFKILDGWRDELYPILGLRDRLVEVERAGSALFGIATRGVHCTAYSWVTNSASRSTATSAPGSSSTSSSIQQNQNVHRSLQLIVPRRSATKSTYPSMLDNTIAGGTSSQETPWLSLLRESSEEAGLPPIITSKAQAVGTVSYTHIRDSRAGGETGLVQPECQYVYDLELDLGKSEEKPRVNDDEVLEFLTLSVDEAWERLVGDDFKPNCGLVLIDFLVRWGYVRAGRDWWMESEIDGGAGGAGIGGNDGDGKTAEGWEVSGEEYAEIVSRLHRKTVWEDVEDRKRFVRS